MKRDVLGWLSLAATFVVTASAEYHLARACGFGVYVAGAVPAALDIYALRALRAGRDMAAVVVAMATVNALSHLVSAELIPVSWPLVVAVSCIAPLVMWRVHVLREGASVPVDTPAEPAEPSPEPAEPEPVPVTVERVPVLPRMVIVGPLKTDAGTAGGTGLDLDVPDWVKRPELEAEPAEPEASSAPVIDVPAGVSAEHVVTVKTWLAVEPELTGTEIGTRLGKSDSYGRRVRRAAVTAGAAP
ncbi:hypothetical protein [Streptomyces sp. MZ04]|uniref:hypothetical protein n=1 Tax=Streptomyces sp. MZ04 TaxID=2559236 RepID=UPI00107E68D3|nr:hypothetical protein [Streptomyces sp. MZ04]TGB09787.1 hypothetical protein E2651_15670 [Streptomyces sp. MZ04]